MKREVFTLTLVIILNFYFVSAYTLQGNIFIVNNDKPFPLENAKIEIKLTNNNTYQVFSNNKGYFLFNGDLQEEIIALGIYLDDCLVFYDNSHKNKENLSIDISIFDTSMCKKDNFRTFAFTPSCSNFPNSLIYKPYNFGKFNQSKTPVLLVHGWGNDADRNLSRWGNFETELEKEYDVFILQYWPANLSNRKNAFIIDYEINRLLTNYYSGKNKFNVVSHSMGGLAVRGYIQDMATNCSEDINYYRDNIDKFVIIASPLYGSYLANLVDNIDSKDIMSQDATCRDFIKRYHLTGSSEATRDLQIGSDFTWELNNRLLNKQIDYLTISGKAIFDDYLFSFPVAGSYCVSNKLEVNDGIVSVRNSNLLKEGYPEIIFDEFHSHNYLAEGINHDYNVGNVASLFFKDQLTYNNANNFLSKSNGEAFYNLNGQSDPLPDYLTQRGGIILNISASEKTLNDTSIYIFNKLKYSLEKNKNSSRYFYVNLTHKPNNYLDYYTSLSIGNYDLFINSYNYSNLSINSYSVNLLSIYLDKDDDHYDDKNIGGSDCNDNDKNEQPNQTWHLDFDNDKSPEGKINKTCERPQFYKVLSELDKTGMLDCNDNSFNINPNVMEICNYVDDNCNKEPDDNIICQDFLYKMNLGDEFTSHFLNGSYKLRFGSLNTVGDYCNIAIINNSEMEFITIKTGNQDYSLKNSLFFNRTICDTKNRTVEFFVTTFNGDEDKDGFYKLNVGGNDCNDNDAYTYPGADEICDGEDNNCNGLIDEEDICSNNSEIIKINLPNRNLFSEQKIQVNISLLYSVDKIVYINNVDRKPREKELCRKNCIGYGNNKPKSLSFNDGFQNITFRTIKNDIIIDEENIVFFIDSKSPKITKTEPKRGISNGTFSIEFIEDNPKEIKLFYDNRVISISSNNDCIFDKKRYKCQKKLDLSLFKGFEINYWVEISDTAGNTDVSRKNKIKII